MSLGILKVFSYCIAPFVGIDPQERPASPPSKDSAFSNLLTKIKTFFSALLSKTSKTPPKENKLDQSRITVIKNTKEPISEKVESLDISKKSTSNRKEIASRRTNFQKNKEQIEEMFPGFSPLTPAEARRDRALRHYSYMSDRADDAYLNR